MSARARKLLVVEDEPFLAESFAEYCQEAVEELSQAGSTVAAEVLSAMNLREAERYLEQSDVIDFVSVDLALDPQERGLRDADRRSGREVGGMQLLAKLHASAQPHSSIGCIMVSGSPKTANEVLDMRDEYGLDYYLPKDRVDEPTLKKSIERALARVRPIGSSAERVRLLSEALSAWKDARTITWRSLAALHERVAIKGIDVDVATLNELHVLTERLAAIDSHIQHAEAELATATSHS